jgi:PAS domain-containing protein
MNRVHALLTNAMMEPDPARIFAAITDAARSLLDAPHTGMFWTTKGETAVQSCLSDGFPPALAQAWTGPSTPLRAAMDGKAGVRVPAGADGASALVAPLADRVGGLAGCLAIVWPREHSPLRAEEEAAMMLVQQASLCLENASLYRMLSQTRDVWQSAFQSIPSPVVIIDGDGRIVQANPAFLALGEFDLATLPGTSFLDLLEGAVHSDGRGLSREEIQAPSFAASRVTIPRLGGDFDLTRGAYLGAGETATGSVWVLRRIVPSPASQVPSL